MIRELQQPANLQLNVTAKMGCSFVDKIHALYTQKWVSYDILPVKRDRRSRKTNLNSTAAASLVWQSDLCKGV